MKLSTYLRLAAKNIPFFEGDFLKSVFSLVKNNNGFFKSEAQGRFLLSKAELFYNRSKIKPSESWAKSLGLDPKTSFSLDFTKTIEQFGHKDATRQRWIGWFIALDESGVVSVAKVKVKNKTKDDISSGDIIPGTEQITFKRDKKAVPPVTIPYFAESKIKKNKLEQQKKDNQPLIKKLQSHPSYDSLDILQSFARQLERGYVLSPAQMLVVNKFFPEKENIELGSIEDWKESLINVQRMVDEKILSGLISVCNAESVPMVKNFWSDVANRSYRSFTSIVSYAISEVMKYRVEIRTAGVAIEEMYEYVVKAINKKGKKLTQKESKAILAMKKFEKRLKLANVKDFNAFWEKWANPKKQSY